MSQQSIEFKGLR